VPARAIAAASIAYCAVAIVAGVVVLAISGWVSRLMEGVH
jgi:hypothetical protein